MSDNEREDVVPKANEWEVVALTESTYAAAPGVKQDNIDHSHGNLVGADDAETNQALLMSGHFGLSPSMHENLPIELEHKEKCSVEAHDHDVIQDAMQQRGKSDSKHEEDLQIEGLISDELPGIPQFDEEGRSDMANPDTGRIAEPIESLDHAMNPGMSNVPKHIEEDEVNELPNLPCEAWWRTHAASLYDHAKNANPFWSIVVAATVMGLVIIGYRWQRDKPQVFPLKSQLVIDEKGSGWILHPMARLKDVSLANQHISYI